MKLLTRESDLLIWCSRSQALVPEAQSQSRLTPLENLFIRKKKHMAAHKGLCQETHSGRSPGVDNLQLYNEQLQ